MSVCLSSNLFLVHALIIVLGPKRFPCGRSAAESAAGTRPGGTRTHLAKLIRFPVRAPCLGVLIGIGVHLWRPQNLGISRGPHPSVRRAHTNAFSRHLVP